MALLDALRLILPCQRNEHFVREDELIDLRHGPFVMESLYSLLLHLHRSKVSTKGGDGYNLKKFQSILKCL